MKVKVIQLFRDKFTKELYPIGTKLDLDEVRVEDLVSRGLVELNEEKQGNISLFGSEYEKKSVVDALKSIGEKATMNMKEETLLSVIEALNKEKMKDLEEALK